MAELSYELFPAQEYHPTWYLEICEANPLNNEAQSILETHHVKICAVLIHNPKVDYLAAWKTLVQVVHNDGYILVSVLPIYAAGTVLSKTRDFTPAEPIYANVKISGIVNYCGIM
jgi:hypothetical protein